MPDITPPEDQSELEVRFKPESGKAIIEGMTTVPFQSFVTLVLQRKVQALFKRFGKNPVIVESELLTSLASAPQDNQEDKSNLVLVSIVAGVLLGIGGMAVVQIGLLLADMPLGYQELAIIAGSIGTLIVLLLLIMKLQSKPKGEKLLETMEKVSSFLSTKK